VTGLQVDNLAPVPTCTVALSSPLPVRGLGTFEVVPDSLTAPTVDVAFSFSTDAGASWIVATPGPAATNPLTGLPITVAASFDWDSDADGVAPAGPVSGVLLQARVDDGTPQPGECTTTGFDVDNGSLCGGLCGDCNLDTLGPTILDALTAARISAGLVTPPATQAACCDVDASSTVTIVDALRLAQHAAGLPATLTCP
jgi:hypothetical protein